MLYFKNSTSTLTSDQYFTKDIIYSSINIGMN